ncbi:hypothetical protein [Sorangium sp. So ce693]|uniref:hypothetical protein n=1 Tax=Sorangium sp. So ce693 TaxID=3133318 RepID=UPI003F644818
MRWAEHHHEPHATGLPRAPSRAVADLLFTDERVDRVARKADVAIRMGALPDSAERRYRRGDRGACGS